MRNGSYTLFFSDVTANILNGGFFPPQNKRIFFRVLGLFAVYTNGVFITMGKTSKFVLYLVTTELITKVIIKVTEGRLSLPIK